MEKICKNCLYFKKEFFIDVYYCDFKTEIKINKLPFEQNDIMAEVKGMTTFANNTCDNFKEKI
jgi:hypothetical protein